MEKEEINGTSELGETSESDESHSPKSLKSLRNALDRLDSREVEAILRNGFDVQNHLLNQRRYHTAIHYVILAYTAQGKERPAQANIRFVDILTSLIQYGVDINDKDINRQTALHMAAAKPGNSDIIKVLLSSYADIDAKDSMGQTALHKAAQWGRIYDMKALLEGGASVNVTDTSGYTPLHILCQRRNAVDQIELILQYNADMNYQKKGKNKLGISPLHVACCYGNVDNVTSLIQAGANVNLIDESGNTCLHMAASHDISGMITQKLLEHHAAVDAQDFLFRETPLHKAIKHRMFENIQILTCAQANPNIRDFQSDTCLHKAASILQNVHTWTLLLKHGGNCNVKNNHNETPLDKALKTRNTVGLAVMRQFNAFASPKVTHRSVRFY